MKRLTPLEAVSRGLVAGIVGTGLMTVWQMLAAKLKSSSQDPGSKPQPSEDPWDDASAPAKVAKRVGEGVFHKSVSPELIPLLTNAMHWGYGTGWGSAYGLAAGSTSRSLGLRVGATFGTMVWLMSYVQLVPMGLYDPPWNTAPGELAMDLSYHLVYGAGVAGAYRLISQSLTAATSR